MTISLANRYTFPRSQTGLLNQHREQLELVASNALAAMGGRMQLLLHGWLIVAWGHSLLFLIAFAAARILPKLVLTVPAGLICDRFPRPRVLAVARCLCALACLLPLVGYLLPLRFAWLIGAIVLSGATQCFDQPARKATLGDITDEQGMGPVVAFNSGCAHGASLAGTVLAFSFGPPGLVVAAVLLIGGALLARSIPAGTDCADEEAPAEGSRDGFLQFILAAPAVSVLVLLGVLPPLLDKGLALALPSFHEGFATMSLALLAPDIGAIVAALMLAMRPARLSVAPIAGWAVSYTFLLAAAFALPFGPEVLVGSLVFAGVAKSVFDITSQVRLQQAVPACLKGRVFAL